MARTYYRIQYSNRPDLRRGGREGANPGLVSGLSLHHLWSSTLTQAVETAEAAEAAEAEVETRAGNMALACGMTVTVTRHRRLLIFSGAG
jgi:hypothetical protein